jgi:hypothetical protein
VWANKERWLECMTLAFEHSGLASQDVQAWNQTWSNTNCGFKGIAGQAITTAPTIILTSVDGEIHVYHGGRFAYSVFNPTETFLTDVANRRLAGARDESEWKNYSRQ